MQNVLPIGCLESAKRSTSLFVLPSFFPGLLLPHVYNSVAASFVLSPHKRFRSCVGHEDKGYTQSKKRVKLFQVKSLELVRGQVQFSKCIRSPQG